MRSTIYLATFFFTLHYAFLLYINSSFLGRIFSEQMINTLYTLGSILAIVGLSHTSRIVNQHGLYRITLGMLGVAALASIGLGNMQFPIFVAVLFLLVYTLSILIRYCTDLYLEATSTDRETGNIRGTQLTVINVAIAISPFIVGKLISIYSFELVYILAGLLLVPTIALIAIKPEMARNVSTSHHSLNKTITAIRRDRDIFNIFICTFLLEFFYAWMVIYTPLYLSTEIGFSWDEIGTTFSIMLIPFVILELPLGRIADKLYGEKELLISGFFIMGLFTASLAYLSTPSIPVWATVLFMTRVGAAIVEIMSESYFFKHVSVKDADEISIFRDARPLAFIIAPLGASALLGLTGIPGLYIALGILMWCGMFFAFRIRDTK